MVLSWTAELLYGLYSYVEAISFVKRHRLWHYFLIPALVGVGLVIATGMFNAMFIPHLSSLILGTVKQGLPEWLLSILRLGGWGSPIFSFILHICLWLLSFLLLLLLFKPLTLILLTPIFTRLSQVTEEAIDIAVPSGSHKQSLLSDIGREAVIGLHVTWKELAWTILIWVLFYWIPGAGGVLTTIGMLAGFGLMDYTLSRHNYSVKESLEFSKQHSGLLVGVGMGFVLILCIPIVGWTVSPTLGVIASTLSVTHQLNSCKKKLY